MIDMTKYLGKSVGIPIGETKINFSIHEDNSVALVLAKIFPPQFTSRIKHYSAKTVWFCEEIVKLGIKLCNIDTVKQLGDIFNKWLTRLKFEYLWKKLIGW